MGRPERSGPGALDAVVAKRLERWEADGLRRHPRAVRSSHVLCGNDYLGLARHPEVVAASVRAVQEDGAGAQASRLVSGTLPRHVAVESALSDWLGVERCLVFSSGYAANTGLLSALLAPGDRVLSDALNHASLIDGLRLARAERVVVPHGDLDAFARALATPAEGGGETYVVTESVFSMDGDVAPLAELVALCRASGAHLIVDEAHAMGVFGPAGRGAVAAAGLDAEVAVRVGTFGKAFGGGGAFVGCSAVVGTWLENRARSYVYSTGLAPALLGAVEGALPLIQAGGLQAQLWERIEAMASALRAEGWWSGPGRSAVFPIVIGAPASALAVSAALAAEGFFVQAIRPPTVPVGTSRLRVTVSASYDTSLAPRFAAALSAACASVGVPPPYPR